MAAEDELGDLIGFLGDARLPVGGPRPRTTAEPCGRAPLPPPAAAAHRPPPPRPAVQIRQHAAELVRGLTGSPEGVAQLAARSSQLLPLLLRLVPGPEPASRPALGALVNLSQVGGGSCWRCSKQPTICSLATAGMLARQDARPRPLLMPQRCTEPT